MSESSKDLTQRYKFPSLPTDEPEDTTPKDILLQQVMNAISERRLKFNSYLSSFVAADALNAISKEIAEAYLTGIDDANRIVKWFKGEGERPEQPTFMKAKLNDVSNYGIQNDPELWQKMYGNSPERGAEMAPSLAAVKPQQAALPPAVEITVVEETYIDVEYRELKENGLRCASCEKSLTEGEAHDTSDPDDKLCEECLAVAKRIGWA